MTETDSMVERVAWFTALRKLVMGMADLHPGDDFFITKEAATDSISVIDMIEPTEIAPPKMFAQDQDAVCLTWGSHSGPRHYATISEGQITMLHLGDGSYKVASTHQISDLDPMLLASFLPKPNALVKALEE